MNINGTEKYHLRIYTKEIRGQHRENDELQTCSSTVQLYKVYNSEEWSEDWVDLNWQQNFNNRNNKLQIIDLSRNRVGKNRLINRLTKTNNNIEFAWLNQSYESYKIKCKKMLLI